MFRCNIEVDDLDLFVRILMKRLKIDKEMVFLLNPQGIEIKTVFELKLLPYFILSDRHIYWSAVETSFLSYIKL